jgi:hypothetical protein
MLKLTMAAAFLASAFAVPVYAASMAKCDETSMMKMQGDVDAMTDPAMKSQKEMAMKEMGMAKDSMKAKKMKDCSMHMDNAMKSMHKM